MKKILLSILMWSQLHPRITNLISYLGVILLIVICAILLAYLMVIVPGLICPFLIISLIAMMIYINYVE
jgi:hypothetical protein